MHLSIYIANKQVNLNCEYTMVSAKK